MVPSVERYREDGVVFPLPLLSPTELTAARAGLDALMAGRTTLPPDERHDLHLVHVWAADLVRNGAILDAVSRLLGPDLLVWRTTLFTKAPRDPAFVAWHQDSAYWGLLGDDVATAWIALTDSTPQNGCLRVVPRSHREPPRAHAIHADPRNTLLRGQAIADVPEERAVDVVLAAGEVSIHHVAIVHGSLANLSDGLRAGLAVRYVAPRVRPARRQGAVLVRGQDAHGHFDPLPLPRFPGDPVAAAAHRRALASYAREVAGEILSASPRQALRMLWHLLRRGGSPRVAWRYLGGAKRSG
jgi:non-heme Fe2+,alpha-ketoglutarate-dependent halogenase